MGWTFLPPKKCETLRKANVAHVLAVRPGQQARRDAFREFPAPLRQQGEGRPESDFLQLSQWDGNSWSKGGKSSLVKEIKPRYKQQPLDSRARIDLACQIQSRVGSRRSREVSRPRVTFRYKDSRLSVTNSLYLSASPR